MPARIDDGLTKARRYKLRHPERVDAQKRAWEAAHPEMVAAQRKRSGAKSYVDTQRERRLLRNYGITVAQYDAMSESQDGLCAICLEPERQLTRGGAARSLSVDHNATSGQVRALLCARCNLAIGNLRESPALFARAADYIRLWSEREQ